ncbi:MAG: hypothetical protein MHM6MM_005083 [Cercozoa sp. M6MM]
MLTKLETVESDISQKLIPSTDSEKNIDVPNEEAAACDTLPSISLPLPMPSIQQQIEALQKAMPPSVEQTKSKRATRRKRVNVPRNEDDEPVPKRRRGRPPKNPNRPKRKYNKTKIQGKRPNTNPFLLFLCEQRELRKQAGTDRLIRFKFVFT